MRARMGTAQTPALTSSISTDDPPARQPELGEHYLGLHLLHPASLNPFASIFSRVGVKLIPKCQFFCRHLVDAWGISRVTSKVPKTEKKKPRDSTREPLEVFKSGV